LTRFAVNAGASLGDKERAVLLSTWKDGFADVDGGRLKAAFIACLRSHTFKTIPTIGDVRQHLSKAEESAAQIEAGQKWEQVLAYAVRRSPDFPDRNPPRISERTMTAIRAAGGLDYMRDCEQESLQWAKKRFVESFIAWEQLEKGQYLLPDGPIKQAFAAVAAVKMLQNSSPGEPDAARYKLLAGQANQLEARK